MKARAQFELASVPDMNIPNRTSRMNALRTCSRGFEPASVWLALTLVASLVTCAAADRGQTFATPQQAVAALETAVNAKSVADLSAIFGPAAADLVNPDRVQATNEFRTFAAALSTTNQLVPESESKYVLEVGTNSWPFPVPIVKQDGGWVFDTEAGKQEILTRRIGRDELATLEVVRAYAEAQREYASRDRNGDQVLEYAQRLASTPGTKDGLYWSPDLGGETSPLGPLVAGAQQEGYTISAKGQTATQMPFHGYLFKILTRQGKHAPGGKYNYIINGHMIGGFALVAWPADYGQSGIMTFIVNQQGRVYEKDLGPTTDKLAPAMKAYDPDPTWTVSPD